MQNQTRIVIENVSPQLDGGANFIKRVVGQKINIGAVVFSDGHDVVECCVKYKHESEKAGQEVRMNPIGNDEWIAEFKVEKQGFYSYSIEGWVDHALNWQHGIERKIQDNQHVNSELLEGVDFVKSLVQFANDSEKEYLERAAHFFANESEYHQAIQIATSNELHQIFKKYPTRILANNSDELKVYVDRKKALFSTWYEFFPRSASSEEGQHGTFKDCERLLPRVASKGFYTI
jgi:starch synthase (maltosyl-transferring)